MRRSTLKNLFNIFLKEFEEDMALQREAHRDDAGLNAFKEEALKIVSPMIAEDLPQSNLFGEAHSTHLSPAEASNLNKLGGLLKKVDEQNIEIKIRYYISPSDKRGISSASGLYSRLRNARRAGRADGNDDSTLRNMFNLFIFDLAERLSLTPSHRKSTDEEESKDSSSSELSEHGINQLIDRLSSFKNAYNTSLHPVVDETALMHASALLDAFLLLLSPGMLSQVGWNNFQYNAIRARQYEGAINVFEQISHSQTMEYLILRDESPIPVRYRHLIKTGRFNLPQFCEENSKLIENADSLPDSNSKPLLQESLIQFIESELKGSLWLDTHPFYPLLFVENQPFMCYELINRTRETESKISATECTDEIVTSLEENHCFLASVADALIHLQTHEVKPSEALLQQIQKSPKDALAIALAQTPVRPSSRLLPYSVSKHEVTQLMTILRAASIFFEQTHPGIISIIIAYSFHNTHTAMDPEKWAYQHAQHVGIFQTSSSSSLGHVFQTELEEAGENVTRNQILKTSKISLKPQLLG